MSFAVVINGPEAMAGFTSNLSRIIGVMVPIIELMITTVNIATPTTIARFKSCL